MTGRGRTINFNNIEVYVRYVEYPYEGQHIRFATFDEALAFKPFEKMSVDECLDVYVGGELKETYYWDNGKWKTININGENN